jgi:hypothetical protein
MRFAKHGGSSFSQGVGERASRSDFIKTSPTAGKPRHQLGTFFNLEKKGVPVGGGGQFAKMHRVKRGVESVRR